MYFFYVELELDMKSYIKERTASFKTFLSHSKDEENTILLNEPKAVVPIFFE